MDLSTTYMGLTLKNPVVPSASPLSFTVDGIRKLEDAGAGAVVVHSLFEEQIDLESQQLDHYLNYGAETYAEALTYFPEAEDYNVGPDGYLELIRSAKENTRIPIIGSLNGVSGGGWTRYAKLIEQAGADALELNVYYIPTNPELSGAQVEQMYLDVVREVKESVSVPVAVKVGPYFTSMANMASRLAEAGADALVLFNRFYQPDLDLTELKVVPNLVLSQPYEMRLPLRWVAILHGRVKTDFAITSGVTTYADVLKAMMAGARVAQVASALLKKGPAEIGVMLEGMTRWMEECEYTSVKQMQGSMSQATVNEPAAFERANYQKTLQSWRTNPDIGHALFI